ncbi:hypothetical protein Ddc_09705 [Ditylenchus destructor]|nr:hypothetical protein Ddc_09705 [Ditylenchus destructor]
MFKPLEMSLLKYPAHNSPRATFLGGDVHPFAVPPRAASHGAIPHQPSIQLQPCGQLGWLPSSGEAASDLLLCFVMHMRPNSTKTGFSLELVSNYAPPAASPTPAFCPLRSK